MDNKFSFSPNEEEFDKRVADQRQKLDSMLNELEGYNKYEQNIPNPDYTLNNYDFSDDGSKSEPSSILSSADPMENTLNINGVSLDALKKIRELYNYDNESKQASGTSISTHAKQLVKSLPGAPKNTQADSSDIGEIVLSFVACLQLAATTAAIGASWLLYLVNHLM